MNNRYPVTIRFNQVEQKQLQLMKEFYRLDERQLVKFAVLQLFDVTKKLGDKLEAERKAAQPQPEEQQCETSSSGQQLELDSSSESQNSPAA